VTPLGRPISPNRLGEAFSAFCSEYGSEVTFHSRRHSSAILSLLAGVDVRTVAGRLGHADPSLTLRVYSHYIRTADEAAASKIGEMLGS
jgi:integrase